MRTKVVIGTLVCALGIGVMAVGLTAQDAASGAKIGTLNFTKVLAGYTAYQNGVKALQGERAKANQEVAKKRQELQALQQKAQVYGAGSPRQRTIVQEMIGLKHEIQALAEKTTSDLNVKQATLLKAAYDQLCKVVAAVGKERGLALVLRVVDPEIKAANTVRLVDGQIGARRVLFNSGELDLTDVVVERLNKAK